MDDVKTLAEIPTQNLGPTKRRIVERLKRADAKVSDLARGLDMTEAGVRQHLDALADHGLVVARAGAAEGLGRVIDARGEVQRAAYERVVPKRGPLRTRVEALAVVRTAEGYVAEVVDD